ncbi:MAG: DUF362 domain-containing protein [Bacteroides sp.]|jgi:uncharacterized protein (DUF362 family)|nr:DUF362 domain-containing protein [Bacteroides sp.]
MKMRFFLLALWILPLGLARAQTPDIASVKGNDVFEQTIQAVELLGGMDRFVKPGNAVGILVNSDFRNRGAYVDPEVVIATIKMAFDAGATDIVFLQPIKPDYWTRTPLEPEYREMIARTREIKENQFPAVFSEDVFVKVPKVEGAVSVKDLELVKELFEVDVFINIPIAKHHATTILTNSMKNLMGLNTRASNVKFHLDGPSRNDPEFLAQCIADLYLVRPPDLIISDVTYCFVTNGPNGPGDVVSPLKVVTGTDPVAVDTYCAQQIGFLPEDVLTIQKGYEIGLGEKDLSKLSILEVNNE